MRTHLHTAPLLLASLLALGACVNTAPANQGATYSPAVAQRAATVQYGVVRSVRTVVLQDEGSEVAGAIVGGLVGGIVGNQFGNGRGNTVMTGIGAGAGALTGAQIGAQSRSYAQEWTIRLDSGRTIAVIQNDSFAIGQPVQVILGADGRARIANR